MNDMVNERKLSCIGSICCYKLTESSLVQAADKEIPYKW
jgi:hypothetical protein